MGGPNASFKITKIRVPKNFADLWQSEVVEMERCPGDSNIIWIVNVVLPWGFLDLPET